MDLTDKIMMGCPWRSTVRDSFVCKALIGQPNGSICKAENCAALYMADLLMNELKAEIEDTLSKVYLSTIP